MTADVLDEALDLLRDTGPEFGSGLSNHGPMAVEAMLRLGRDDAVLGWVERYLSRLQDHPAPELRIRSDDWQTALGNVRRVGDWITFFDQQLAEAEWPAVIATWVPRLAPGLMAGATHGLIRTAHATRAIAALDTPQRRHEVAEGLGYWAARYQTLPGQPSGSDRGESPDSALIAVPRLCGNTGQLIFEEVRGLDAHPDFADVIDLVDTPRDITGFLSSLTATFAAVALANPQAPIAFIHSVTAPSALRMLLPYVSEAHARLAARYAWQASAALYAWFATAPPTSPPADAPTVDTAQLVEEAVASGDEHAIKFTEACLREQALNPHPVYLAAASAWVGQLQQAR